MQKEVMDHFALTHDFRNVGYFETEHHKSLVKEITSAIKLGKLIAITGIVGCGKTTTLRMIAENIKEEKEIIGNCIIICQGRPEDMCQPISLQHML